MFGLSKFKIQLKESYLFEKHASSKAPFLVFPNIRFLKLFMCVLSVFVATVSYSQTSEIANAENSESAALDVLQDEPNSQETQEQQEQIAQEQASSPQSTSAIQPILRLEDTIRGNKEQPQVLTIVPWQLPVHQRISENKQWGLQVNQQSSIERNAFLRRLAVVKEIKAVEAAQEQQ